MASRGDHPLWVDDTGQEVTVYDARAKVTVSGETHGEAFLKLAQVVSDEDLADLVDDLDDRDADEVNNLKEAYHRVYGGI